MPVVDDVEGDTSPSLSARTASKPRRVHVTSYKYHGRLDVRHPRESRLVQGSHLSLCAVCLHFNCRKEST